METFCANFVPFLSHEGGMGQRLITEVYLSQQQNLGISLHGGGQIFKFMWVMMGLRARNAYFATYFKLLKLYILS